VAPPAASVPSLRDSTLFHFCFPALKRRASYIAASRLKQLAISAGLLSPWLRHRFAHPDINQVESDL
jgi:hypothetical protein